MGFFALYLLPLCSHHTILSRMKTPKHKPDPRLRKSHAHESAKDYKRRSKHSDEWSDHFSGMPALQVEDLIEEVSDEQ